LAVESAKQTLLNEVDSLRKLLLSKTEELHQVRSDYERDNLKFDEDKASLENRLNKEKVISGEQTSG
jgi:hypothetical protein